MTNLLAADPTLSVGGGKVESQRALHGKLMEIDLGEEARARNIAETERARRRLAGQILEEEEDADGRRKKVRLGPDGKPWRSRNRRDSDALKRDQQVEEFLRENRREFHSVPLLLLSTSLLQITNRGVCYSGRLRRALRSARVRRRPRGRRDGCR